MGLNKTLFTLIPKVSWPTNVKEFKLISLLHVSYKIITKVVANRFKDVMFYLISNTQTSFMEGRNIPGNIILTQEVIHSMRKKNGKKG